MSISHNNKHFAKDLLLIDNSEFQYTSGKIKKVPTIIALYKH